MKRKKNVLSIATSRCVKMRKDSSNLLRLFIILCVSNVCRKMHPAETIFSRYPDLETRLKKHHLSEYY